MNSIFCSIEFPSLRGNDVQMMFCRHGLTKAASTKPPRHAAKSTEAVCEAKWEWSVRLITMLEK